jgi:hypothetical protein
MSKGKTPSGSKGGPKAANDAEVFDAETKRAQRRVAKTRDKLHKALQDPDMRQQMVEAIRQMMRQGKE